MFALRRTAAASAAFGAAVAQATVRQPAALVGVEHEFRLLEGGRQVDARPLIHDLDLGQRDLDPADPYAYRLADGSAITCDGRELEIAIAPVPVAPGFAVEADARAIRAREQLQARLGPGRTLIGYSTHLSISVVDDLLAQTVERFVRAHACALMLLLDGTDGVGLLVRPRPGRLELGGAFASGRALRTALVFAVGAAMDVAHGTDLPALQPRLEAARDRFGVYVDRRAFGGDLYMTGRRTPLRPADGAVIDAQSSLTDSWRVARAHAARLCGELDLVETDDVVSGALPLPTEGDPIDAAAPPTAVGTITRTARVPFGVALGARERPEFGLAPVMLTWQLAVFLVDGRRRAFAAVPGDQLGGFLEALDAGTLDEPIASYLRERGLRRTISRPTQARTAGLWDRLGARRRLLAQDPPPAARAGLAALVNAAQAH